MIVSFLSQKGGVGKSTLARGLATLAQNNTLKVQLADMDCTQQSTAHWAHNREQHDLKPLNTVVCFKPREALSLDEGCDFLIIDGTPYATHDTLEIATASDLVVIPTGISLDDLRPAVALAKELTLKTPLKNKNILMVVMKVPQNGSKEAMTTKASVREAGFNIVSPWLNFRTSYSQASDKGLAVFETPFAPLNTTALSIFYAIAEYAQQTVQD